MITVNAIGGASAAAAYYAADNYYTKEEGLRASEWFGKGAEMLGLSVGDVCNAEGKSTERGPAQGELLTQLETKPAQSKEQALAALLSGKVGGQQLGKRDKDGNWRHDPGKDIGFSVHKSVTVMALVGGDKRVQNVMRDAMYATMTLAETHLAQVRDRAGGEQKTHNTGNITGFVAFHTTNRNGSPDLHAHFVMANATLDPRDGQWKPLWTRPFYANRFAMERVFNAEMARGLREAGYNIGFDKKGFVYLADVPKAVSQEFSDRRPEIERLSGKDASWLSRSSAAMASRDKKVHVVVKDLIESWMGRAQAKNFDFEALKQNAAKAREGYVARAVSSDQLEKAIQRSAAALTAANVTTSRFALLGKVGTLLEGAADVGMIDKGVDRQVSLGNLVFHGKSVSGSEMITTKALVQIERDILAQAEVGALAKPISNRTSCIQARLDKTNLKDGQKAAALTIITSSGRFVGLQAPAGTGKTYMMETAISVVGDRRVSPAESVATAVRRGIRPKAGINVFGIGPSHAATNELQKSIGGDKMTVQRLVSMAERAFETGNFSKLEPMRGGLVILDESSLVGYKDAHVLGRLANRLEFAKLVALGDSRQTEAPVAGPFFSLIQKTGYVEFATLDELMRQKDSPRLKGAIEKLYDGNRGAFFKAMAPDTRESEDYVRAAARTYVDEAQKSGFAETLAVSFDNRTKADLSAAIRNELKASGHIRGTGHAIATLNPVRADAVDRTQAKTYAKGDYLAFHSAIRGRLDVKAGSLWRVRNVDRQSNSLVISPADSKRRNTKVLDLDRLPETAKIAQLSPTTMEVAQNDRVRIRMRSDRLDLTNADIITVSKVTRANITGWTDDKRHVVLPRGSLEAKTLEQAFVSTAHQAQGQTVTTSIVVANPNTRAATEAGLLVGVTRARQTSLIFTDDVARLEAKVREQSGHDVLARDAQGLPDPETLEGKQAERATERQVGETDNAKAERNKGEIQKEDREGSGKGSKSRLEPTAHDLDRGR